MSMVLNMVGGGGGSLKNTDAILIVTASAGATVTATKGGITLTPTIWTTNADNTLDCALFNIKASTFDSSDWTVKATLNGYTQIGYVVINAAKEYELDLSRKFWIYKDGAQKVPLESKTGSTVTFQTSYIRMYYVYNNSSVYAVLTTSSSVNVTDYSTLWFEYETVSLKSNNSLFNFGLNSSAPTSTTATWGAASNNVYASLTVGQTQQFSLDVSSLTGSYYIGSIANSWGSGSGTMDVHINKIWLEE